MTAQPEETAEAKVKLIIALLNLAYILWLIWTLMVPAHQKQMLRMRAYTRLEQLARRTAHACGSRGIALEAAAGSEQAGRILYRLSTWLMTDVAGWAGNRYERERG